MKLSSLVSRPSASLDQSPQASSTLSSSSLSSGTYLGRDTSSNQIWHRDTDVTCIEPRLRINWRCANLSGRPSCSFAASIMNCKKSVGLDAWQSSCCASLLLRTSAPINLMASLMAASVLHDVGKNHVSTGFTTSGAQRSMNMVARALLTYLSDVSSHRLSRHRGNPTKTRAETRDTWARIVAYPTSSLEPSGTRQCWQYTHQVRFNLLAQSPITSANASFTSSAICGANKASCGVILVWRIRVCRLPSRRILAPASLPWKFLTFALIDETLSSGKL
jgi:hypothetical protein